MHTEALEYASKQTQKASFYCLGVCLRILQVLTSSMDQQPAVKVHSQVSLFYVLNA